MRSTPTEPVANDAPVKESWVRPELRRLSIAETEFIPAGAADGSVGS